MTRDDRGPSHDPTRTAERPDPRDSRTPPARPDERGTGEQRADRIASRADERTTSRDEPSQGTAAASPEEIDRESGVPWPPPPEP